MLKTITLVLFLFNPDSGWQTEKNTMKTLDECVDVGRGFVEQLHAGPDTLGWKAAFGCQVEIDRSV